MKRFTVAFITPQSPGRLIHDIIEAEDKDEAISLFFATKTARFYSNDDKGLFYFKEDFSDPDYPSGSIIEIDTISQDD